MKSKNTLFWANFRPFLPIFMLNPLLSLFLSLGFYCRTELQGKLINIFQEKLVTNLQTEGYTDKHKSVGTSLA